MVAELFSQIRSACEQVADQARHVSLNRERIEEYAAALPAADMLAASLPPEQHLLGADQETLRFFIALHAINFGSGYFPYLEKRPGMGGYNTVATCFKEYCAEFRPPSAAQLAEWTAAQFFELLEQDPACPVMSELLELYARAWRDLGRFLLARFHGSAAEFVYAADGSAAKLVDLLAQMPLYRDVHDYHGIEVPFFKRAQITAADLALAFNYQGPGRFADIDDLTMFADNAVPQMLMQDGLLRYSEPLTQKILRQELLISGSEEEVEIRACALHAVELLAQSLRQRGAAVPPRLIDFHLWYRRQQPEHKQLPSHRTRCTFY